VQLRPVLTATSATVGGILKIDVTRRTSSLCNWKVLMPWLPTVEEVRRNTPGWFWMLD
jgi:hypothetical protein